MPGEKTEFAMVFLFAAAFESWLPLCLRLWKGRVGKMFAAAHSLSAHQLPSCRVHSVCFVPVMAVRHWMRQICPCPSVSHKFVTSLILCTQLLLLYLWTRRFDLFRWFSSYCKTWTVWNGTGCPGPSTPQHLHNLGISPSYGARTSLLILESGRKGILYP